MTQLKITGKIQKLASLLTPSVQALIDLMVPATHAADIDPEEKVYYYLQDHLGGVDVVLNEDGDVVQQKDYLPFGNERLVIGDADEQYGFTGGIYFPVFLDKQI